MGSSQPSSSSTPDTGHPIQGALEMLLDAYLATRRPRFSRYGLDHRAGRLFVDVRGRALSVEQVN